MSSVRNIRLVGGLLGAAVLTGSLMADPDPAWVIQVTLSDCSGSSQQQTGACEDYSTDLYEHIDYTVTPPGAATADIQLVNVGFDDDYYYVEFDYVAAWDMDFSTSHQVVIEIDVDPDTESHRGDYYVGLFQKQEFNGTSWVDAHDDGGYAFHVDNNDDVGGNNPTASDFGGSAGDGYEDDVTQNNDQVWARIVGGNFQVAIRRTSVGNPTKIRLRSWSRQSTSLPKEKLYFHDQNAVSDVEQIDNLSGLPGDDWVEFGPAVFEVVKRAYLADGTPLASGTTVPAGSLVRFMLYLNNAAGRRPMSAYKTC